MNKLTTLILLLPIILTSCDLPVIISLEPCSEIKGTIEITCNPTENLIINSYGGLIKPAIYIAERTTNVKTSYVCMSSCVLIVSRAKHRIACSYTTFGLHQSNFTKGTELLLDFYAEDERLNYEVIKSIITDYPYDYIYEFNSTEALGLGIIDEIINC